MKIAVTGHRPNKLGSEYINKFDIEHMYENYGPISKTMFNEIEKYLKYKGCTTGICGMAIGIDQIFAHVCLHLGIPFIAAVPCDNQASKWPTPTRMWYDYLISRAVEVINVSPGPYAPWKMQKRNQWMSIETDEVLAIYDGSPGGTRNCVEFAKSINKNVKIINPKDFYGMHS